MLVSTAFYPIDAILRTITVQHESNFNFHFFALLVKHHPTSFNNQSSRAIVLFGEENQKLWQITSDALKAILPADQFPATEAKLKSFAVSLPSAFPRLAVLPLCFQFTDPILFLPSFFLPPL